MSITIQCQCSRVITVSEELSGQPTRCPSCGRRHLIPQVRKVQVPEVRKAELSGHACRECHTELVRGAEFCHSCGLPHATPKSVIEHVPVAASAAPAPPVVPVPVSAAPQPHMPVPQMAHPFSGCCPTSRRAQNGHNGPFAAAMQPQKPVSGLARVSMSCAYIAILLGIFTALAAVPMAGHLSGRVALEPAQAHSLLVLVKGMGALIALFSFVGLLTGFLGLFHVGRKRCGAVLGMVLCFMVGVSAVHNIKRLDDRYRHQAGPPPADVRTIDQDCNGCDGWHGCPHQQQQQRLDQERLPEFAPAPVTPDDQPSQRGNNGIGGGGEPETPTERF